MIISAPHISGWISVLILSATVYALGSLLGEEISPKTRRLIVWSSVAVLIAVTVGSLVGQAFYEFPSTGYCSWAWWDFIIC